MQGALLVATKLQRTKVESICSWINGETQKLQAPLKPQERWELPPLPQSQVRDESRYLQLQILSLLRQQRDPESMEVALIAVSADE